MPPIKLYTHAPLHPDGVTPKTAEPETAQEQLPQPTRTTNLPQTDPSLPPPPQPGARPQPGPAPTAGLAASPPPPQPSAVPHSTVTAIHTTTTTGQLPPPTQFNIPPPTTNQAPTHSTYIPQPSPFETGASAPLTHVGGLHRRNSSVGHPPGYQQNPYAIDGSASDRTKFEEAAQLASEEEGVMGTVRNLVNGAGKTLEKLEDEAWKWAKGKK
jgi:hypothetical protein